MYRTVTRANRSSIFVRDLSSARGVMAWIAALSCALVREAQASQPDDTAVLRARVVNVIRSKLPKAGSVHAVYVATAGFGEVHIGFDAATGAWYYITGVVVSGRDTLGAGFAGAPRRGEIKPVDQSISGADAALDSFLPTALARDLVQRPETIQAVTGLPNGGFRLTVAYTGGMRDGRVFDPSNPALTTPRNWLIEVDNEGLIAALAFPAVDGAEPRIMPCTYDTHGPEGFRVLNPPIGHPFRLASVTHTEHADPAAFSRDRVESLATQSIVTVRTEMAQAAVSQGINGGSSPGSSDYNPLARYQYPLLATGIVVTLVGIVAIRRSRLRP